MSSQRFPIYRQLEAMDCGPTCLRMVAKHFGRDCSLALLRDRSAMGRQGVSMSSLCDAAEAIGLRASAADASYDALREERPFPAIVHWRGEHFVVLYDIDGQGRAHLADPAHGRVRLSRAEFERSFGAPGADGELEGTILFFTPTPAFYEEPRDEDAPRPARGLGSLLHYLRPYRRFLLQMGAGLAATSLLSLGFAFLNQSLVDVGINGHDLGFVNMVLLAQLLLFAGAAFGEASKGWITLHVGSRINIAMTSDFLAKLTRLPMAYFDGKLTGDLMQRIGDLGRVQTFLTSTLPSTAFMLATLLLYAVLLLHYSTTIFLLFFGGSTLYGLWISIFLRKRKELDYRKFDVNAGNQSGLIALLQGMQDIKMHNAERRARWRWERLQVRLFRLGVRALALEQYQSIGSTLIHKLKNILITFVAARAVIAGELSLGMMMTIQFVLGTLDGPVVGVVGFVRSLQDANISLERLGEVLVRDDEEPPGAERILEVPVEHGIHLHDVSFHYEGPHAPLVLSGLDLEIPAGRTTAIVGASGSGKTTLVKLLLRYYGPTSGTIAIGPHDADAYALSAWREQCGVVMQDGFIFSDTIAGNIAVADDAVDRRRLLLAAKVANIQEFVDALPLGYRTKIGSEGIRLSGGQRQRILIARAVYKDPQFLFFDEATSSLDAENERRVMENLGTFCRGRTTVIVAHRLSTVRHADQIVVLGNGRVLEQGDHAALTAARGTYFSLIRNQLELGH